MADTIHDFEEMFERLAAMMKKVPVTPMQFYYPTGLVEQAAEPFKNHDCYINGFDDSHFYYGEQPKMLSFYAMAIDLSRLNARIATMDLPDYLRQVYPKQNTLYRLDLLYRNRYMFYGGRRGNGKSILDLVRIFYTPQDYERRYLGKFYYTDEGE